MLNDISLPHGLRLRTAKSEDQTLMKQLFKATREYLQRLPLSKQQIDALLDQQYELQQASYTRQWPNAHTLIIQLSGTAIGKITLDESETILHIVDIALKASLRGKGYGTSLLRSLQAAAAQRGLQVGLSVDRQNLSAKKLYRMLGFQVTKTTDTHESMIWSPSADRSGEQMARKCASNRFS